MDDISAKDITTRACPVYAHTTLQKSPALPPAKRACVLEVNYSGQSQPTASQPTYQNFPCSLHHCQLVQPQDLFVTRLTITQHVKPTWTCQIIYLGNILTYCRQEAKVATEFLFLSHPLHVKLIVDGKASFGHLINGFPC